MKLRNVYILCRDNIDKITDVNFEEEISKIARRYNVSYWNECYNVLVKLYSIECFKEVVNEIYSLVSPFTIKRDDFVIDYDNGNQLKIKLRELSEKMRTIVDFYGMVFKKQVEVGFDVKLAECDDLNDFANQVNELKFIIQQCPFLKVQDSDIKFGNVDVGSTWLTFLVCGTAATMLLKNLAALIDKAIIIKSHILTCKEQQERLKTIQIKNEIAEEVSDALEKLKNQELSDCVLELGNKLEIELRDGEEEDRARRSIEKLAELIERGMQIYTSIDAPEEVKAVFPAMEVSSLPTDTLKMLSENKK